VRIGDVKSGQDIAFLKIANETLKGASGLELEMTNLVKIRDSLQISPSQAITVPQVLGSFYIANTMYCLESAAQGTKLSRIVRRLGYFSDLRRAEKDFAYIVGCLIDTTKALKNVAGARAIDSSWRDIPEEFRLSSEMCARIEAARYFGGLHGGFETAWVQHGDMSVENIFLDPQTGRIEVLDWADMANGFPPLYDLFSLFYSTGYLHATEEGMRFPSEEERWIATFNTVFASDTGFGQTAAELTLNACERLKVPTELIPALLVEFLLVRSHYFVRKSLVQQRIHQRLLQICVTHNLRVFGRFQIGDPSFVLSKCKTASL
jgi:Phosphotransferase enzyme family